MITSGSRAPIEKYAMKMAWRVISADLAFDVKSHLRNYRILKKS